MSKASATLFRCVQESPVGTFFEEETRKATEVMTANQIATKRPIKDRGNVLLMVLVMIGVSLTLVAAIFGYGSTNVKQNQRTSGYYAAVAAAEATTEKLVAQITSDYRSYGDGYLMLHLNDYMTNIPNATESAQWTNYDFLDTSGAAGRVEVQHYDVP